MLMNGINRVMFYYSAGSRVVMPPPLPHGSLLVAYGFPTLEGVFTSCFDPESLRVMGHCDDGIDLIGKAADAPANGTLDGVPLGRVLEQPMRNQESSMVDLLRASG